MYTRDLAQSTSCLYSSNSDKVADLYRTVCLNSAQQSLQFQHLSFFLSSRPKASFLLSVVEGDGNDVRQIVGSSSISHSVSMPSKRILQRQHFSFILPSFCSAASLPPWGLLRVRVIFDVTDHRDKGQGTVSRTRTRSHSQTVTITVTRGVGRAWVTP